MKCVSALFLVLISFFSLNADEVQEKEKPQALKEESVTTEHTLNINGNPIAYSATVGTLLLKDNVGKAKGSFFYTAYVKKDVQKFSKRPIMFCFNGGPGSSSIWLHMGVFGPKKVYLSEKGYADPPYTFVDNPYSLIDLTDLVFIDPISTGYSRAAPGEDPKQFHGVEEDIQSIAEFIRLYVTKNERWESPKFLAGESYGTTRAAGLSEILHNENFMYFNGIVLLSSVLDFQTLKHFQKGNDLPYVLFLPTYAATAWYHHKLDASLQKRPLKSLLQEVQEFAANEYWVALMRGERINESEKAAVVKKLAAYTGLSEQYVLLSDIRINMFRYAAELLRDEKKVVGRFDGRYVGVASNPLSEYMEYDPSADAVFGAFTATFNQYIRQNLGWKQEEKYEVIAGLSRNWNYSKATNEYLNVSEALRDVMTRNPTLQVFVANGYYDLATPYFATDYTFDHLGLDPAHKKHVTMEYYDAGHMMYIHQESLVKLKEDLRRYFEKTLNSQD